MPPHDCDFDSIWHRAQKAQVRLTEEQGRVLHELASAAPECVLEVGSLFGGSSILLASAANRLFCVDPFNRSPQGPRDIFPEFLENVASCPWWPRISAISRCDHEVFPAWPDETISFFFLDHEHTEAAVLRSLEGWKPKLRPGALIALHDFDHPDFPGVRTAVEASGLSITIQMQGLVVGQFDE